MEDNRHAPVGIENTVPQSYHENYANKLLLLKSSVLEPDSQLDEFQYFYAKCGFGCYPVKLGTKVFGEFLLGGETSCFRRSDFLGVADNEKLPDWTKERLQCLPAQNEETPAQTDITM